MKKQYEVRRIERMQWTQTVEVDDRDEAEDALDVDTADYFEPSPVYEVSLVVPPFVQELANDWAHAPEISGDNGLLWDRSGGSHWEQAETVANMLMESPGGVEFCARYGDEVGGLLFEKVTELLAEKLELQDRVTRR